MIFREFVDNELNFIVTYDLEGKKSLRDAAWELAIGQSVGNPNVRNQWESDDLFDTYSGLYVYLLIFIILLIK